MQSQSLRRPHMRRAVGAVSAVAVFAVLGGPLVLAAGDRNASATNGKKVATRVCAGCHDVSDDLNAATVRRPGVPPPLLTVAASPDLSATELGKFLRFPHGEMDNLVTTRRESDYVVAYIMSLRRK